MVVRPVSDEDICQARGLDFANVATEFGVDPDAGWDWGQPVLSKESGIERAATIVQELEADMVEGELEIVQNTSTTTASELRLLCPLSACRIHTPVVGKRCRHLQCYDLAAYIATTRKQSNLANRWVCPVCARPTRPQDLTLDHVAQSILHDEVPALGDDAAVRFDSDGSWSLVAQESAPTAAAGSSADGNADDLLDVSSSSDSENPCIVVQTSGPTGTSREAVTGNPQGAIPNQSTLPPGIDAEQLAKKQKKLRKVHRDDKAEKYAKKAQKSKKDTKDKKDKKTRRNIASTKTCNVVDPMELPEKLQIQGVWTLRLAKRCGSMHVLI